jgi:hypothetical protein
MSLQHQLRVRLTLPPDLHREVAALPPSMRSQAVSTVLIAAADGIDMPAVIAATEQLRRAGSLLNQALHYAYVSGSFDAARASEVVRFIDRMRGRS